MSISSHDLTTEVAITTINKLLKKSYFSICDIDRVAQMLRINPRNSSAYDILSALHCVDYADMTPNVRNAIPTLITECLSQSEVFQFPMPTPQGEYKRPITIVVESQKVEEPATPAHKPGYIARLLGRR